MMLTNDVDGRLLAHLVVKVTVTLCSCKGVQCVDFVEEWGLTVIATCLLQ